MLSSAQSQSAKGGSCEGRVVTLFFVFGEGLTRFLGKSGLNVITRLMGLILAVIGVQMLIDGIDGAFKIGTG
jgi:small neutral amino acid transporter SnatA (MarC family)